MVIKVPDGEEITALQYLEVDGELVQAGRLEAVYKAESARDKLRKKKKEKAIGPNMLKAISKDDDTMRVANYLALWDVRDLEGIASERVNPDGSHGEYYTPQTNFESAYTKTGRLYVDWDHGLNPFREDGDDMPAPGRDDVLGYVDWSTVKTDESGLWVERVLNRRNKYMRFLETLIDAGLIGTSSEAMSKGVEKALDGHIVKWPLRRDTMTVSPMEWRMMKENPLLVQAVKGLLELPEELPEADDGRDDAGASCQDELQVAKAKAQAMTILARIEQEKQQE